MGRKTAANSSRVLRQAALGRLAVRDIAYADSVFPELKSTTNHWALGPAFLLGSVCSHLPSRPDVADCIGVGDAKECDPAAVEQRCRASSFWLYEVDCCPNEDSTAFPFLCHETGGHTLRPRIIRIAEEPSSSVLNWHFHFRWLSLTASRRASTGLLETLQAHT